jgi:hypothetical protein
MMTRDIKTAISASGTPLNLVATASFQIPAISSTLERELSWRIERGNSSDRALCIEYVLDEFGNHVKDAFANLSNQLAQMRDRKQKLEGELRRLAATAAETGPSAFLIEAIHEREQPLRDITDQLLAGGTDSVDAHLSDIRSFVTRRLGDLRTLLSGNPVAVRKNC